MAEVCALPSALLVNFVSGREEEKKPISFNSPGMPSIYKGMCFNRLATKAHGRAEWQGGKSHETPSG